MNEIQEFYQKVMSDEKLKMRLSEILKGGTISDADDDILKEIGVLASEMGYDITLEKAKKYLQTMDTELEDDELDAVAGGSKDTDIVVIWCEIGGSPDCNK